VWLEKPERIAALAMLTVVGLLVYAVIQRQVRLYAVSANLLYGFGHVNLQNPG
jgi:transposase